MRPAFRLTAVLAVIFLLPSFASAQGLYIPGGAGAHLSMGGASTAKPVDAIGALYWNPAAIGRLGRSEAAVGGTFLIPNIHLDSTAPGGRRGVTRSDSGVGVASSLGVVYQPDESDLTYGLGLMTLGGGGVNFPGDTTNPILSGIGPLGNVQGPIASNIMLVQMTPTVSYKLTERLIFGFGPTIDIAVTSFDPAFFGAPDDANGDGVGTFPTGSHARPFWGGGLRAGLVYSLTDDIDVGFGYTSPQWFEPWTYYARDEIGRPRVLKLTASLPAIYSWGIAYQATENLLLALDLRYFDYKNADLFGPAPVDGGLGYRSCFAVALGSRYQINHRIAVSAGYVHNTNPIPTTATLFNIQGPVVNENTISVGSTFHVTESFATNLGYAYGFENSISGPVREATGAGVRYSSEIHMITFSMQFLFGGGCGRKSPAGDCDSDAH